MSIPNFTPNMKLIFLIILSILSSYKSEPLIIRAKDIINYYCLDNIYYLKIKILLSSPIDYYISFTLNMVKPNNLKFKCLINYQDDSINCFSVLYHSEKNILERTELEFPYYFPDINGVSWDYDSFVSIIYRRWVKNRSKCFFKNIDVLDENVNVNNYPLVADVKEISGSKCNYEQNKYIFNMKINFKGGVSAENIKNEGWKIQILQDIWVPLLFEKIDTKNKKKYFGRYVYFQDAFCSFSEEINKNNFNNEFLLKCNIPIDDEFVIRGPIKIVSFYDQVYVKVIKGKQIELVSNKIYFNSIRNVNLNTNNNNLNINNDNLNTKNNSLKSDKDNLVTNNNLNIKNNNTSNIISLSKKKEISETENNQIIKFNEPNDNPNKLYSFDLGGNNSLFFCPNKPIFKIDKLSNIKLLTSSFRNYTIELTGTLHNPYRFINGEVDIMEKLISDINFNLTISDNLIEESENKKTNLSCLLKLGVPFNEKNKVNILCTGIKKQKGFIKTKNADIILNWDLIENKKLKNLIILWPKERKHYKNLYSYIVKGLSLMQNNYGCFNNQFYFFIFIYDLGFEPPINFDLEMRSPNFPKANCKLYDSISLKCYLPLYNKKIFKGENISMPVNIEYENINSEGNRVVFKVSNFTRDYYDFHILMKEDCGDFAVIGALKNTGMSFLSIVFWIIGVLIFIFIVFVCLIFFIYYKITHKGRKGKYYAYIEESGSAKVSSTKNN